MSMTIQEAIHKISLHLCRSTDLYNRAMRHEYQEAAAEFKRMMEAEQMAIDALCEKAEREDPQPLALEELRQMKEATPVWWQYSENTGFWCLEQTGVIMVPSGRCYDISESEGRVYRHKPKEAKRNTPIAEEPPAPVFRFEKGNQPHGAEQFAKACAVCVNEKSDLCRECKMEKKSGFEPPF